MKTVLVESPQFGEYLAITVPLIPFGWSTVYVGPLLARAVRVESIHTGKASIRTGTFNEKPCEHDSVSGLVRYEVPNAKLGDFDAVCSARHSGFELERIVPRPMVDVTFSLKAHTESSPNGRLITLEWSWRGQAEWSVIRLTFSLVSHRDALTGGEWFEFPTGQYIHCEGIDISNIQIGIAENPYGEYLPETDALPYLTKWFQTLSELGLARRVGQHRSTRDAAIYAAIDNLELADINWLCDLSDIVGIFNVLKQLCRLLTGILNWRKILHNIATLRLLWVYVIKTNILTAKELRKLTRFLKNGGWKGLQAAVRYENLIGHGDATKVWKQGGITYHLRRTAKVVYGASSETRENLLNRLSLLGFLPNLGDLWDIVPFSFVVDWVIPVQDYIVQLEKTGLQARLPLKALVLGGKVKASTTQEVWANGVRYIADLDFVNYTREVLTSLPGDMYLGLGFKNPLKQWITGTALFILVFGKRK